MQVHPGKKIQIELKDRGWTQRQFAFFLGKKVSELNELIKGKRNITVQWDILLSHVLGTPRKYWLELQNEYDYSLLESEFDLSKLPQIGQNTIAPEENSHQISEQEIVEDSKKLQRVVEINQNNKFLDSGRKTIGSEGPEQEKKEVKLASHYDDNSNSGYKIDKDVDISKQKEKHPKLDSKNDPQNEKIHEKNISIKEKNSNLDSEHKNIFLEGQKKGEEKKDKNSRQKIYNEKDKFDSYFPPKERKEKYLSTPINIDKVGKNKILDSGRKIISPEGQEKIEEKNDDHKDHHKHKEHIFRNF